MVNGILGNTNKDKEAFEIKAPSAAPSPLTDDPPSEPPSGSGQVVIHIYSNLWVAWQDDESSKSWVLINSITAV